MKRAKLFLVGAALIVGVGGAFALKAHKGIQGDLLTCPAGVCVVSTINDNGNLGGVESDNSATYYTGTAGQTCNTTNCSAVVPPQIWTLD